MPSPVSEQERYKNFAVKRMTYKILFFLTMFAGLVVFVISYQRYVDGNPGILFERPTMIFYLLMPFVPPFFFLFLSNRAQDKLKKLIESRSKG